MNNPKKRRVKRHSISFPSAEGLTKQNHKDECDINHIMKRFQKTGMVDHVNESSHQYGTHTGDSYFESMLVVAEAKSMFETLPASARKEFDNSPEKFLRFTENPNNQARMVELGLSKAPPPPTPSLAEDIASAIKIASPEATSKPEPAATTAE